MDSRCYVRRCDARAPADLGNRGDRRPRGDRRAGVVAPRCDRARCAGAFPGRTGAPPWAGGAYDGAVRVPAAPRNELGVSIATLRHEVMHAQLHAAVGCLPVWFNEGTAMYFAGAVPALEWLKLLRTH